MPTVDVDGVVIHYEIAGAGEVVALVGDAGFGAWQWGPVVEGLAGPHRVLVWDLPGTGRSDEPTDGFGVDSLAGTLETVLSAAAVERCHVIGAGLGGMVALRYARDYGRARSLTLLGTAGAGDTIDEAALRTLHPADRSEAALQESLTGAFTADYLANAPAVEDIVAWRCDEDATGAALTAHLDATLDFSAGPLYQLSLPALVCHGETDPVVPPTAARSLADGLPTAEFVPLAGRHLAYLESGHALTDRLVGFLADRS